jgi:hypothetical protein
MKSGMGRVRALEALGVLALAALSGCGSSSSSGPLACPQIVPAPGADAIALFGPGGHAMKDVMVGGRFYDLSAVCTPLKVGLDVTAQISFYAERVSLGIKDATLPYFVALVGPDQQVLAQEQFQENVAFLPGETYRRTLAEKITVHLPLRNKSDSSSYTVIVGFQLTPDQIAFNRAAHPQ